MRLAPLAAATAVVALSSLASAQIAPDGLPVNIPAPGSAAPTTAEWDAVTEEVTVKGSSALHCQTKMIREWLRVSCTPFEKVAPKSVTTAQSHGYQAFTGMFGTKASLVVQVVKGKLYVATFGWGGSKSFSKDLAVNWAKGDRPLIYFN
jgi:hypothetical protein